MKISFHGAARTVTGSKHIIHINNGKKILLDCGMFQGLGGETDELNAEFGFEPSEITHVILSHAHIDHSGLLPRLVKQGYTGKIFCTEATRDLTEVLLADSAFIQENDAKFINKRRAESDKPAIEPFYTIEDARKVFPMLTAVPYNENLKIDDDVSVMFTDAGHIIGSASVNLQVKENGKTVKIHFSGDVGRYRDVILKSPQEFPQADFIILESTYGNSMHDANVSTADRLRDQIQRTCLEKGGKLLIPAFSVGRTQELLFALNRLELERRLPAVKYYVDSPLSLKTTQVVKSHPECFNKTVQELMRKDSDPFMFNGLTMIEDVEDSKRLNFSKEPCVIISASGMAEAGRIKHHIANNIHDARNTILIVGFCEPSTLGAKLAAGEKNVRIFGDDYEVKAEVEELRSMSAHGDYEDLSQYLACQEPRDVRKLFLVHGEYDEQQGFRNRLIRKGFLDVEIPHLHQEIGLGV